MSLYTRLMGLTQPKITVHTFSSMMAERKRGKVTNQDIIDAFQLSPSEQTEVIALWSRVNSDAISAAEVDDVLLCAEARVLPYDTEAKVKARLGV
jgi:hypothetical protein